MGEKGQPGTSQNPAATGAISGNTVSVPLQQGAVQSDSDWGGTGGVADNTVGVPLQQGAVQSDSDWGGTGGVADHTVGVPQQQGAVQHDSDWAGQSSAGQGGEKGQTGSGTLADMNLQNQLSKESQSQEQASNLTKKVSDAADALMGKVGT